MNAPPQAGVPAALPLSLLEAMRALDVPRPDALDETHGELAAKRFGLSRTVEAEIARLERLTRREDAVPGQEFAALQRLVARRPDAALVFSEAGRRAARRAVKDLAASARLARRLAPGGAGTWLGLRLARGIARTTFGVQLDASAHPARATLDGPLAAVSDPGPACSFIGSALAELLRRLTSFDGAMLHVTCRSRGAASCAWTAAVGSERSA